MQFCCSKLNEYFSFNTDTKEGNSTMAPPSGGISMHSGDHGYCHTNANNSHIDNHHADSSLYHSVSRGIQR